MKFYAILSRAAAGIMLILAWGLTHSPLLGVVFLLTLTALSAIRYRIKPYSWLGKVEGIVCVLYAFLWIPALLGLWFPIIGFLENCWTEHEHKILQNEYKNRAEFLKLKREQEHIEFEKRNVAQLTELSERARIAQDIHDHVGHEVTGALIALQTAIKLHEANDPRTKELLQQTFTRLESASENLRETVHNLKPAKLEKADLKTLRKLCEAFVLCPVKFTTSGILDDVFHFELLSANLKEALTNVSRHSNASNVEVKLDGNIDYVRLTVHDNGSTAVLSDNKQPVVFGLGLSGMKERVRAAGGTMSINTDNGFKIICVIPKL